MQSLPRLPHHDPTMTTPCFYYKIAVAIPHTNTFTYSFSHPLAVGTLVQVPFRNQKKIGLVIKIMDSDSVFAYQTKSILKTYFSTPILCARRVIFFQTMAKYYCAQLGDVIKTTIPGEIGKTNLTDSKTTDINAPIDIQNAVETTFFVPPDLTQAQAKVKLSRSVALYRLWLSIFQSPTPLSTLKTHSDYSSQRLINLKAKGLVDRLDKPKHLTPADLKYKNLILGTDGTTTTIPYDGLNAEQKEALLFIKRESNQVHPKPILLFGVTGSGKTEVYMHAIQQVLESSGEILVLVPEITLTPQLVGSFYRRFGDILAILHSDLTPKERLNQWLRVLNKSATIVIGVRSALFAPFQNLKLIIIDEEHDNSFKQDSQLRYQARDMAILLASILKIPIILGSATPSIESFHNANTDKFHKVTLAKRAANQPLPTVSIIDMKNEHTEALISQKICQEISLTLKKGKQVILLLNRRGFSNYLICKICGETVMCPACNITLTFHKNPSLLRCHYCDFSTTPLFSCAKCQSPLVPIGLGIQQLETEVHRLFPAATTVRIDRDTVKNRSDLIKILTQFSSGKSQILIGTQMVSKGHDFPNVTLVGVINADHALSIPDFRSAERTFQLITQVVGRAGRGKDEGKAFIQTYNPNHYSIENAKTQNYPSFFANEFAFRTELHYPPLVKLALIEAIGTNSKTVSEAMQWFYCQLEKTIESNPQTFSMIDLFGPSEAAISKIKNRFRWQLLVKSKNTTQFYKILHLVQSTYPGSRLKNQVSYSIDIDPRHFM